MDTDDEMIAATLAGGLLAGGKITYKPQINPSQFAVMVYFDCLDAVRTERERRHRAQAENQGR
jgi:hypothetical protein